MRYLIIGFINNYRLKEKDYEMLKETDAVGAEEAVERFFGVQIRNAKTLKQLIKDYQPTTSGTAWGNDPDYILLARELRESISTGNYSITI
jgi:hypothetical protein